MASIFTKIINGDIPSHKVAENDDYLAFLDIRPLARGHTLVIPKVEVDYLFDLEDDQLAGLMAFAKRVAKGLEATVTCKRIGVIVVGTEVPHAHVHLVPFQEEAQIDITRKPIEMAQDEMAALAIDIHSRVTL